MFQSSKKCPLLPEALQIIFVLLLSFLSVSACVSVDARSQQVPPSGSPSASPAPLFLPARFGEVALQVELARTDAEQQKGLMFRKTMPADQGMLFVFEREQHLGFWMKNTYLPLSIAFLNADFVIVDIQDMMPLDEKTHLSAAPALYALEMNQGWFREHKIGIGAKLQIQLPAEPS